MQQNQEIITMAQDHLDQTRQLVNISGEYFERYGSTRALADLETAIQRLQEAVDLTPHESTVRVCRLQALGALYIQKYGESDAVSDLEMAIQRLQTAFDEVQQKQNGTPAVELVECLAFGYLYKYRRTNGKADRDVCLAVNNFRKFLETASATVESTQEQIERSDALGSVYHAKYATTMDTSDLEKAIQNHQHALELTPEGDSTRLHRLSQLANIYFVKYEKTEALFALGRAIDLDNEVLAIIPSHHPTRVDHLYTLGKRYESRFRRTAMLPDLAIALQHLGTVVEETPENHPHRLRRISSLAMGYHLKYERTRIISDLNLSLQYWRDAIDAAPEDHLYLGFMLDYLGGMYHERHRQTGALSDLETALQYYQSALNITPQGHNDRPHYFQALGTGYIDRFRHLSSTTDIDLAIQYFQRAVDTTPESDTERAARLSALGHGYFERHGETGSESDAEIGIQMYQCALDVTAEDDPEKASRHESVGRAYLQRHASIGISSDLETSLEHCHKAFEMTPEGHPKYANRLASLAGGYLQKYDTNGALSDLDLALNYQQKALDATPEVDSRRADRLRVLGQAYNRRYMRNKAISDLEARLDLGQRALEMIADDHPDRPDQLEDLGTGYKNKYERTGAISDLELSIRLLQRALDTTPKNHVHRAGRLDSLGDAYTEKYAKFGAICDIELALKCHQGALELTHESQVDRPRLFQKLGSAYSQRYMKLGAESDFERCIQLYQSALDTTPKNHPEKMYRLHSLGYAYHVKYERDRDLSDLDMAIQKHQDALDATPKDHPWRVRHLNSLGFGYDIKYQRTGYRTDLDIAVQRYKEVLNHTASSAKDRLRSIKRLFALHAKVGNWSYAYQDASAALSLIPLLTQHYLETADRQFLVAEMAGLASDAAAAVLMAGQSPYEAIRLLELGRGIIINSINEIRVDISELQQKYPQLAAEFIRIREKIDTAQGSTVEPGQRYHAGQELEHIIKAIRERPEFERLLLAPSEEEMKAAANKGSIVIINVSDYRCDALIIEHTRFKVSSLPNLQISDIQAHRDHPESCEVLEWLWETVVKPVLDALGHTQTPEKNCSWPRIWWITTGPMAQFPIHAAGYHGHGSSNAALDRVVSSYTSSVVTLIYCRQRCHQKETSSEAEPKGQQAVLVGMEELQHAPREIRKLEQICQSMQLQVNKPEPYQEDVLSALRYCKLFHFAGHGKTDSLDPLKSSLILRDGHLAVARLFELNLHNRAPYLAYLSACGTGENKHNDLIDESLHLVAACQLVGFRHVIGTLWRVSDEFCVDIATMVYGRVLERGLSDESVSEALHYASRKLRDRWVVENAAQRSIHEGANIDGERCTTPPKRPRGSQVGARDTRDILSCEDLPLNWVPYVHFGV